MVNVGGRSRGCSTCRRRRVKCDETRPVCNRCQRCGLACSGPRDIAFVEGTILRSRRTDPRTAVSTRSSTGQAAGPASPQVPQSVSLQGFEFEIYICFARKNLRRGASIDVALQETQLSDIVAAGTTAANGQIFHQAILCFATILFGAQHKQTSIINRGYAVHGVALKQLNEALSDAKCYTRDEVILSVATLAILECAVPTGPRHYLEHMAGLERLLALRDPRSFCSPKSCELYKSVRHMILFASLRTGKPSILARAEWKTVLRANCSEQELQEQDLFDVLADCTVLIAKRDDMVAKWESNLEGATRQRDEIQRKALGLVDELRAWKTRWDGDATNSYTETPVAFASLEETEELGEEDTPPAPTTFEFSKDSAAIMLMFYNTALIYVLRILVSLPSSNPGTQSNQSHTEITLQDSGQEDAFGEQTKHEYVAAERSAALEICRCIPQYEARTSRPDSDSSPVVQWAVPTAWMTLRGNESPGGRRIIDLLNTKSRVVAKGLWVENE